MFTKVNIIVKNPLLSHQSQLHRSVSNLWINVQTIDSRRALLASLKSGNIQVPRSFVKLIYARPFEIDFWRTFRTSASSQVDWRGLYWIISSKLSRFSVIFQPGLFSTSKFDRYSIAIFQGRGHKDFAWKKNILKTQNFSKPVCDVKSYLKKLILFYCDTSVTMLYYQAGHYRTLNFYQKLSYFSGKNCFTP